MSNHFWLTEAQMARLGPFFPKNHGKPRVDDGGVMSSIIFIERNACGGRMPQWNMTRRRPSATAGNGGMKSECSPE
jgi:transposase